MSHLARSSSPFAGEEGGVEGAGGVEDIQQVSPGDSKEPDWCPYAAPFSKQVSPEESKEPDWCPYAAPFAKQVSPGDSKEPDWCPYADPSARATCIAQTGKACAVLSTVLFGDGVFSGSSADVGVYTGMEMPCNLASFAATIPEGWAIATTHWKMALGGPVTFLSLVGPSLRPTGRWLWVVQ